MENKEALKPHLEKSCCWGSGEQMPSSRWLNRFCYPAINHPSDSDYLFPPRSKMRGFPEPPLQVCKEGEASISPSQPPTVGCMHTGEGWRQRGLCQPASHCWRSEDCKFFRGQADTEGGARSESCWYPPRAPLAGQQDLSPKRLKGGPLQRKRELGGEQERSNRVAYPTAGPCSVEFPPNG